MLWISIFPSRNLFIKYFTKTTVIYYVTPPTDRRFYKNNNNNNLYLVIRHMSSLVFHCMMITMSLFYKINKTMTKLINSLTLSCILCVCHVFRIVVNSIIVYQNSSSFFLSFILLYNFIINVTNKIYFYLV